MLYITTTRSVLAVDVDKFDGRVAGGESQALSVTWQIGVPLGKVRYLVRDLGNHATTELCLQEYRPWVSASWHVC